MKKLLITISILIVFSFFSSSAQKNIGVLGGTSLSNVRIRNVQEPVAPLLPSEYQTRYAFSSVDITCPYQVFIEKHLHQLNDEASK